MKVKVTDMATEMKLGNNGITLEVRDNDETHMGTLRIGRGGIFWRRSGTQAEIPASWNEFVGWFEEEYEEA